MGGPMTLPLVRYHCENCGNDGGDAALVLIEQVVGKILLGRRVAQGIDTWVTDGGPEHFERQSTHVHEVWCDACGTTMIPIESDDDG
jgi:hypothetical protein